MNKATFMAAVAGIAGATLAQPTFTNIGNGGTFIIGLFIADNGQAVAGYVGGSTSFLWRATDLPQLRLIAGGGGNGASGVNSSVDGMDAQGNKMVFSYKDPIQAPDPIYTGGLAVSAVWENNNFTILPVHPLAAKCDVNLMNPMTISGDGLTYMSEAWGRCRVAPFAWRDGTGWTAWATLPQFATFPAVGYESHKLTGMSRDGTRGCGWFQSGTGYGGRTGVVWLNNGQTVMQVDQAPHDVLWGTLGAMSRNGKWAGGQGVPDSLLPPSENMSSGKYVYRWSLETGPQILGKIETGGTNRHPNVGGISDNGRIIVGQDSFGLDRGAFIWTPESGGMRLDAYLAQRGLDLSQSFIQLTSAVGCSKTGQFITGQWADFGGSAGAFVIDLGPQACNEADVGSQGGLPVPDYLLDNNDFVVFINLFFAGDARADVGIQGGTFGHDTQFDNNDFVVFINLFFAGC